MARPSLTDRCVWPPAAGDAVGGLWRRTEPQPAGTAGHRTPGGGRNVCGGEATLSNLQVRNMTSHRHVRFASKWARLTQNRKNLGRFKISFLLIIIWLGETTNWPNLIISLAWPYDFWLTTSSCDGTILNFLTFDVHNVTFIFLIPMYWINTLFQMSNLMVLELYVVFWSRMNACRGEGVGKSRWDEKNNIK